MITVKKNDKKLYNFCLWKHWNEKIYCDEDELRELYENLKGILYPEIKPDFHLNCDCVNCKHSDASRKTYLDCLRFSREDFPPVREENHNG